MPRFFTATEPEGEFIIDGENGRHICRSLRMRPGEKLTLCDGMGFDYSCEIISAESSSVIVRVLEKTENLTEPKLKLSVFQGIPKGDKMELIIQKAVELGAGEIVPTITEHCISDISGKEQKKLERWNKIALEAAKQSGRGIIPKVLPPVKFSEAVKSFEGRKIFFYEGGGETLSEIVSPKDTKAAVFIGPEGGFSPAEVKLAEENGAIKATLGPRILRTETAAMTAAALVMYATGNMD